MLFTIMQLDINDKMRAILIDWLVEVHLKFKVWKVPQPAPRCTHHLSRPCMVRCPLLIKGKACFLRRQDGDGSTDIASR